MSQTRTRFSMLASEEAVRPPLKTPPQEESFLLSNHRIIGRQSPSGWTAAVKICGKVTLVFAVRVPRDF